MPVARHCQARLASRPRPPYRSSTRCCHWATGCHYPQVRETGSRSVATSAFLQRYGLRSSALFRQANSADRAEKATVIVTTNLPFSEWSQAIPNSRLCKALIDRLKDRAHIITTGWLLSVPTHDGAVEGQQIMKGRIEKRC